MEFAIWTGGPTPDRIIRGRESYTGPTLLTRRVGLKVITPEAPLQPQPETNVSPIKNPRPDLPDPQPVEPVEPVDPYIYEEYTDIVQHPGNIWVTWSAGELAAKLSAYPFVRAVPLRGHRITKRTYALVSEQVVESIVTSRPKNLDRTRGDLTVIRLAEVRDLAEEKQRATMGHGSKQFQVDERSQSRIVAEALHAKLSKDDPATFPWDVGYTWLAADNSQVPMTVDEMLEFAAAARAHVRQIIFNARAHKDALLALTTPRQIHEYDITTGWP